MKVTCEGSQMVSNISPAQPMKMDTFERLLAGECNRSDMMVGGGIREVEGEQRVWAQLRIFWFCK